MPWPLERAWGNVSLLVLEQGGGQVDPCCNVLLLTSCMARWKVSSVLKSKIYPKKFNTVFKMAYQSLKLRTEKQSAIIVNLFETFSPAFHFERPKVFDVSSPSSSVVLQHLSLQVNLSKPPWFKMYTTRKVDGKPYCLKKGELSEGPMSTNMLDALSSDFLYKICTYMYICITV